MNRLAALMGTALFAALSAGCARAKSEEAAIVRGSLEFRDAVAPAPIAVGAPSEQLMAGYMHITNVGPAPDTLFGMESSAAAHAMLHETTVQAGHAMMSMAATLIIPSQGSVHLVPGEQHIMMDGLRKAFHAGDTLSVTLLMGGGRRVNVPLTVIPYDSVESRFPPPRALSRAANKQR